MKSIMMLVAALVLIASSILVLVNFGVAPVYTTNQLMVMNYLHPDDLYVWENGECLFHFIVSEKTKLDLPKGAELADFDGAEIKFSFVGRPDPHWEKIELKKLKIRSAGTKMTGIPLMWPVYGFMLGIMGGFVLLGLFLEGFFRTRRERREQEEAFRAAQERARKDEDRRVEREKRNYLQLELGDEIFEALNRGWILANKPVNLVPRRIRQNFGSGCEGNYYICIASAPYDPITEIITITIDLRKGQEVSIRSDRPEITSFGEQKFSRAGGKKFVSEYLAGQLYK